MRLVIFLVLAIAITPGCGTRCPGSTDTVGSCVDSCCDSRCPPFVLGAQPCDTEGLTCVYAEKRATCQNHFWMCAGGPCGPTFRDLGASVPDLARRGD